MIVARMQSGNGLASGAATPHFMPATENEREARLDMGGWSASRPPGGAERWLFDSSFTVPFT
jgi:hypothetical protein